ncbi:MAG: hypothetical protein M3N08_10320, partial [Pseudomonadota bacterium]|nr:hypothetical protein [Pseudomonadota bacterium]
MRPNYLGGLFILALVVRLIFVVQWHGTPYGPLPLLDALAYDNWAQDIAKGHIAHGRAFYMMPLFPYLLALLYAVFGHSLWIPSILNAGLGAATCAVLADLAFGAFGFGAAVTTGVLAALYRPLIFYTPPVMKETLG